MTEDMTIIAEEAYSAAREILEKAKPEAGLRWNLSGNAGSRRLSGSPVL